MEVKAYAKINLSLDIVGKREDGYHLLKMVMQSIDLYDLINVKKIDKGINISCNKKYIPIDIRNSAYKAAELFIKTYGINGGADIDIVKNIPVAAGLAGGSSDAAAVLKCMRDIYKPEISDSELADIGVKIGADIPYCIFGGTALSEGIGEIITPLKPFKNHILVVVKPPFGVSTKEVYSNFDMSKVYMHPNTEAVIRNIEQNNLKFLCRNMRNLLENVTLNKHRILKDIKKEMMNRGAVGTLMSGSGPTVFAFFNDMLKAQRCYDYMKCQYKEAFITRTI